MASKAKKRGKIVEEPVIEDKENASSRRIGRAKKAVNYCEDTPSPAANKKKGSQKPKTSNKLEREAIQNAQTSSARQNKNSKQETADTSDVLSKIPQAKTKGKQKDSKNRREDVLQEVKADNRTSRQTGKKDGTGSIPSTHKNKEDNESSVNTNSKTENNDTSKIPKGKSKGRKKVGKNHTEDDHLELQEMEVVEKRTSRASGKPNDSISVELTPRNKDIKSSSRRDKKGKQELPKEAKNSTKENTEENKINELNKSGFSENDNSRKRRHSKRGTSNLDDEEPNSSDRDENDQDTSKSVQGSKSKKNGKNKSKDKDNEKTGKMNKTFDCVEDIEEIEKSNNTIKDHEETTIKKTNESNEECSGKNKNNDTFTMDNVPETPVSTGARRTPGRNLPKETPSSEQRVQQVKENLRNSLCGNTPTGSGHGACSDKFSQVYEILQLVTDQLSDLKNDMENIKSTNESMKTELESSRNDSRQLREEMCNLKNTTANQIASVTAKIQSSQVKSPTIQNEMDILWQQCDAQKKTIRTLHSEVDNTKLEFHQKLDKFKKAMIFILCKTRPDMTHSDVSRLRDMLSKSEKHLDLTLDEICSFMEFENTGLSSAKKQKTVPNIDIKQSDKSDKRVNKKRIQNEDQINGNSPRTTTCTPVKDQLTDPFKSSHRIKRTPVANPSK